MMPKQTIVYSVSDLSAQIKQLLEMSYVDIWVEGEVSSLATPASGHTYFTLKEGTSILKCVLFKNKKYLAAQLPIEGKRILIRGRISMYTGRGEVQLICAYIEAAGEGELRRQFDALKNKLKLEGLFDEQNKQVFPPYPKTIALITSPQGAVLHDIITTLKQRYPCACLNVYPASVQGEKATEQILQALVDAESNSPDIIIFARGGGSLEDLQTFNDETLARAVFNCPIPTVSAVGHETDFSIVDFVADLRAPTPTAAVTLITPDIRELKTNLSHQQSTLNSLVQRRLNTSQQMLDGASQGLIHPRDRLLIMQGKLQQLKLRLSTTQQSVIQKERRKLEVQKMRLAACAPDARLQQNETRLQSLGEQMNYLMSRKLQKNSAQLEKLSAQLRAFNPLNTLARGYAIVQDENGEIVTKSKQVNKGDKIYAQFANGTLGAQVTHHEE